MPTAVDAYVALTERHYAQAAALFGKAAEYAPPGRVDKRRSYLWRQADALSQQGDELGDNAALRASITLWRQLADQEYPRERVPLYWASTQMNLALALSLLGERESDTARLNEAAMAFRATLEEWTRERLPLDWARTQGNLGNTLEALGERESGTARLVEAVAAYRAALEEMTREQSPLEWATTQNNLGNALWRLGERESGNLRLEEALAAHRAALEEESMEAEWPATMAA